MISQAYGNSLVNIRKHSTFKKFPNQKLPKSLKILPVETLEQSLLVTRSSNNDIFLMPNSYLRYNEE